MARMKKNETERELVAVTMPHSLISEQFRRLRTNLNFSSSKGNLQTLIVTSANAGEGKSMVAANLAIVYAQEGKKVLLVDSDLRNPTVHKTFRMQNDVGLSTLLTQQVIVEKAVRKTAIDNLDLLCSGPIPSNPSELLSSKAMEELMEKLKLAYDFVIFDSPAILSFVDGQIIANKCDASIFVINSGKTDREQAIEAKEAITSSGSKVLGVILNNNRKRQKKALTDALNF
jgi:capsular exopolysaccharide synthesis family protein